MERLFGKADLAHESWPPDVSGCRKHFTLAESAHGGGAVANAQLTPAEVNALFPYIPSLSLCSFTAPRSLHCRCSFSVASIQGVALYPCVTYIIAAQSCPCIPSQSLLISVAFPRGVALHPYVTCTIAAHTHCFRAVATAARMGGMLREIEQAAHPHVPSQSLLISAAFS